MTIDNSETPQYLDYDPDLDVTYLVTYNAGRGIWLGTDVNDINYDMTELGLLLFPSSIDENVISLFELDIFSLFFSINSSNLS